MSLLVTIKIYVQIDAIVVFGFTCCACLPYRRVNLFCNKTWHISDHKSEYIYTFCKKLW